MNPPKLHVEPEAARRKLAEAYRKEAANRRWKKRERAAFLAMAESWQRTVQNK